MSRSRLFLSLVTDNYLLGKLKDRTSSRSRGARGVRLCLRPCEPRRVGSAKLVWRNGVDLGEIPPPRKSTPTCYTRLQDSAKFCAQASQFLVFDKIRRTIQMDRVRQAHEDVGALNGCISLQHQVISRPKIQTYRRFGNRGLLSGLDKFRVVSMKNSLGESRI